MEYKITARYETTSAVFHVVMTGAVLSSRKAETINRLTARLASAGIVVETVEDVPPVTPAKGKKR